MLTCSFSVQQLAADASGDNVDDAINGCSLGTIVYEIAPGAPLLSRRQVSNVLCFAGKYLRTDVEQKQVAPDVRISVKADGLVELNIAAGPAL